MDDLVNNLIVAVCTIVIPLILLPISLYRASKFKLLYLIILVCIASWTFVIVVMVMGVDKSQWNGGEVIIAQYIIPAMFFFGATYKLIYLPVWGSHENNEHNLSQMQ